MFRAVIVFIFICASQSAFAQFLFGPSERPTLAACMAIPENKVWIQTVTRQLRERAPKLNLGRGTVTIKFHVDFRGRVTRASLSNYDNNARALVAAGMITSLKLAPPPDDMDTDCRDFEQTFNFH
ncbi:hypothetical protein [Methylosinus sp. R-45379]|uniref:hypothetical protein n=1 Tax=Methylosinus sp. R-45379 TaxID=980563 RepID=UPI000A9CC348|nr:hypothetical protein [Methylosinus sp. R-45379]